jgi:hypothetical protein
LLPDESSDMGKQDLALSLYTVNSRQLLLYR